MKRPKIAATVILIIIAAMLTAAAVPWDKISSSEPTDNSLQVQEWEIMRVLGYAGSHFQKDITLTETTDSNSNQYYIGEISPELNALLEPLVDAYNASPSPTDSISVQEIRRCLTNKIADAARYSSEPSPFIDLLHWCNEDADLIHLDGSEVSITASNYMYIADKDGYCELGIVAVNK